MEIPAALHGERIDRALSLIHDVSRIEAESLIKDGRVVVSSKVVRLKSYRLKPGDSISVSGEILRQRDQPVEPRATVELEIIYSDDVVLVVNKKAGQVVHPGAGGEQDTMVAKVVALYDSVRTVGDDPKRPGVVHRLDKGTSGVMMFALTQESYDHLVEEMKAHRVHRRYLALVEGLMGTQSGVVDAPIGRSGADPKKMALSPEGKWARSHFRVLSNFNYPFEASLLEIRLETGRTHQIRVHMQAIGHPVVGDHVYGGRGIQLDRPFLHSEELRFAHPVTDEPLEFHAELPADLKKILDLFS